MAFLLDTHTIIWHVDDSSMLGASADSVLNDRSAEVYVSVASFWEMAIKISNKKLCLPVSLESIRDDYLESGVRILPIEIPHTVGIMRLPHHHRDPFDRLLVAQALAEDFTLISRDDILDQYGVKRIWD